MHTALKALFAEHDAPQHSTCEDCHTIAGQVLDLAAALQKQSVEYRRLLWQWKTAPDAGAKDKYEWFKQTIDANDAAIGDVTRAVERMVDVQAQLDRYMAELKTVDPAATMVANPALPNV